MYIINKVSAKLILEMNIDGQNKENQKTLAFN